ncbi:MAG TPA: DUF6644 family protein [Rhizobiaceae bacterium]|nr:DUF6644 family protein [Rhizobiaceae bacterium]
MNELLGAIERLPAVAALKSSFFAYPIVNALHILAIGALVTAVLLMDFRLLGAFVSLPSAPFSQLLRRVALMAFTLALATGVTMFAVRAREYAGSPVFLLKLTLIAVAIANFLLFIRLQAGRSEAKPPTPLMRLSAVCSILLWLGVLFAGRFIGFY